jgi:6-phosphofructokinase 1
VAAGAVSAIPPESAPEDTLKRSLAPLASGPHSAHVIRTGGHIAQSVALQLQRLTDQETYPLVLGELVKAGAPTAVDRQLGLGYGAAAVQALHENHAGTMVAFQPPDISFVPLEDAINRFRTVPAGSVFVQIARSLGISLGD